MQFPPSSHACDSSGFESFEVTYFNLALDLLGIGLATGYFTKLNPAWERTLGYSISELCSRPWIEFVHPDDRERTLLAGAQLATGIPVISFQNRYRHANGSYVWLDWRAIPRGQSFYGIARDVTKEKEAAEALRESEQRLQGIFQYAGIGIVLGDLTTQRILRVNPRFSEILGYQESELVGMPYLLLTHPEDRQTDQEKYTAFLRSGTETHYRTEKRYLRKDGEVVWARVTATIIDRDEAGRPRSTVALVEDLTEQKRLQERAEIFFNLPTILFSILGSDARLQLVNPGHERILGFKPEEMLGRNGLDFIHPDDHQASIEYRRSLPRRQRKPFVNRTLHKDGSYRYIEWIGEQVGELVYFTGRDVTHERQAAEELREQKNLFETILDNIPTGLSVISSTGKTLIRNKVATQILGESASRSPSIMECRDIALLHPDRTPYALDEYPIARVLRGKAERVDEELIFRGTDGHESWLRVVAAPYLDAFGAPAGCITTYYDTTEQKSAEQALRSSESRFRCVYESGMLGILFMDIGGRIRDANDAFLEILGYTREELDKGLLSWCGLTLPGSEVVDGPAIDQLRAQGVCEPFEKQFLRKDGSRLDMLLGGAMVEGSALAVVYALDISHRKRSENERERLVQQLQHALNHSELVMGALGHDLRNPLSSIVTSAHLLLRSVPHEGARRSVNRILTASERMARMIENLLDFTRIRLGEGLAIQPKATELGECTARIVEEFEAAHPELVFMVETRGNLEGTWDAERMMQVFSNFIGNAIQHAATGTPIRISADGMDPKQIVLAIHNEGAEIPPELLPVIFQPFRGAGARRGERSRGLGLGLYISEQIVQRHGGRIEVQTGGEGTTFIVFLPRRTR